MTIPYNNRRIPIFFKCDLILLTVLTSFTSMGRLYQICSPLWKNSLWNIYKIAINKIHTSFCNVNISKICKYKYYWFEIYSSIPKSNILFIINNLSGLQMSFPYLSPVPYIWLFSRCINDYCLLCPWIICHVLSHNWHFKWCIIKVIYRSSSWRECCWLFLPTKSSMMLWHLSLWIRDTRYSMGWLW